MYQSMPIQSYGIAWLAASTVTTVKHAYNTVPRTGDFASLKAEFVISVKSTTHNKVLENENHFAVHINSL